MMQHRSAARVPLLAADSADIPTPVHQHHAAVVASAKKSISDAARGAKASKRNVGSKKRRQSAAAKSAAVAGSAAPVRKHGQETASKAASRAARGITTANHCRYWRIQPDIPGHKTACKHEAAGRACPYIHDRTYARGRRHKLQASLQDKIARSHAALDSRPRRRWSCPPLARALSTPRKAHRAPSLFLADWVSPPPTSSCPTLSREPPHAADSNWTKKD